MAEPIATINAPTTTPKAISGKPQPVSGSPLKRAMDKRAAKPKAPKVSNAPKVRRSGPAPAAVDPFAGPINAALDAKYGPAVAATNQAIMNSQAAQMRNGTWWTDYQNSLQAEQQRTAQQAQALAAALNGYNPQAAHTGNPQADQLAAQAQQSQHYLGQAFAGQEGQLAQNTANQFATGLIPGAAMAGQQAVQAEANKQQALRGAGIPGMKGLQELASERGNDAAVLHNQYEAAAQKAALDQANLNVKQETLNYLNGYRGAQLGIQQQNANTSAASASNQGRVARTNARTSRQQADTAAQRDAYQRAHGLGPYKPPTTPKAQLHGHTQAQANAHHKIELAVNNAVRDVQHGHQQGLSDGAIRGAMQLEHIPGEVIDAATTLANGGTLTANQVKQLKLAGLIAPPRAWTAPKRIKLKDRPR